VVLPASEVAAEVVARTEVVPPGAAEVALGLPRRYHCQSTPVQH
jgi:hypothetical protein